MRYGVVLALTCLACSRTPKPHPSSTPSVIASSAVPAPPPKMVALSPEERGPVTAAAPLDSKQTDIARRKEAVFSLLEGGSPAERLQVVDTDPDQIFNPFLSGSIDHFVVRGPRVESRDVDVTGGLSVDAIQRVVRRQLNAYSLCYGIGLFENPTLEGRVRARLDLDTSGTVAKAADAGSDVPSSRVRRCVVQALANLAFPPPPKLPASVMYTLVLSPD
jgi:hypothetical protein